MALKITGLIALIALFHVTVDADEVCATPLDFATAIQRTLDGSLHLKIARQEINARAADQKQANLTPNPFFVYEANNVGSGSSGGGANGWNGLQNYFEVNQVVELGGKRQRRLNVSDRQYEAAIAQYKIAQISVLNELSKAFIAAVNAQEELKLAEQQKQIAHEALKAIKEKASNGKVAPIELNKAEIDFSSAELEQENAAMAFSSAKETLALQWGCKYPDFEGVAYSFYEIFCPLSFEECLQGLYCHPAITLAHLNFQSAQAVADLEKSAQIPDLSLMMGYTSVPNGPDQGLSFGVAMPIPIFDRNQGNIARAHSMAFKAQEEEKLVWLHIESQLSIAHKQFVQAYKEAEKIRATILEAATKTFELAKEGYKEGKYEYLDVLDAQSTFFEIQARYIQALANYHSKKADIEYLSYDHDED